jgi:hypothetical protein
MVCTSFHLTGGANHEAYARCQRMRELVPTYTTAPSLLTAGLRVDALTAGGLGLVCIWLFAYARPRRLRVYGAESFKSNSPHS